MELTPTTPSTAFAKAEADTHSTQLKSDLRTLADDIETLRSDVAALGKNQVNRMRANVADVDQNLSGRLSEKPIQTLAVAFAAGYLFAVLTR